MFNIFKELMKILLFERMADSWPNLSFHSSTSIFSPSFYRFLLF